MSLLLPFDNEVAKSRPHQRHFVSCVPCVAPLMRIDASFSAFVLSNNNYYAGRHGGPSTKQRCQNSASVPKELRIVKF